MIEYLKITIPTIISLFAAIFSFLTYKRNRRIENENYIFKTKQENYSKILYEIARIIDKIQEFIIEANNFQSTKDKLDDKDFDRISDQIDALADTIDDMTFNLDNLIISNSLVFPKSILEKLEKLTDLMIDTILPGSYEKNLTIEIKKVDAALTEIINYSNSINDSMRIDLNIEELNLFLYKRLKK